MAENLSLLANCAASALLFGAFCVFVGCTVALYSGWRALRATRKALPDHVVTVQQHAENAARVARQSTDRVVRPQITLASTLVGIRAGARSLFGVEQTGSPSKGDVPD